MTEQATNSMVESLSIAVASAAVPELAKAFSWSLRELIARRRSNVQDQHDAALIAESLELYLQASIANFRPISTILKPSSQYDLYDLFVPPDLKHRDTILSTDLVDNLLSCRNAIVTGTGGSGKSTLSKHVLVQSIVSKKYFPILVQLRRLNVRRISLIDLIVQDLATHGLDFSSEDCREACCKTKMILLLDGLDEVDLDLRDAIDEEIKQLARPLGDSRIVLFSRPDPSFASWHHFEQYRIQPLSQLQSILLAERLPLDEEVRQGFLRALQDMTSDGKTFLSNPLLLSLMALVYTRSGQIPPRDFSFYKRAFYLLFHEHDTSKGTIARLPRSGLSFESFEKAAGAFAFQSYLLGRSEFDSVEARDMAIASAELTREDFEPEPFISDLETHLCILLRDGRFFSFIHKTFQEYFAAQFYVSLPKTDRHRVQPHVFRKFGVDNVAKFVFDLSPEVGDTEISVPLLNRFEDFVSAAGASKHDVVELMMLVCSDISIPTSVAERSSPRMSTGGPANSMASDICRLATIYHETAGFTVDFEDWGGHPLHGEMIQVFRDFGEVDHDGFFMSGSDGEPVNCIKLKSNSFTKCPHMIAQIAKSELAGFAWKPVSVSQFWTLFDSLKSFVNLRIADRGASREEVLERLLKRSKM